jgi:hypothetical protein
MSWRRLVAMPLFAVMLICGVAFATDDDDEQVVRIAIYTGKALTTSPPEAPFASVLVLPPKLGEAFKKKPKVTVAILEKIIDGASPRDSILAVACALSLLDNPVAGAVCVEYFDEKVYDTRIKDSPVTPRKQWLSRVNELRKRVLESKK